MRRSPKPLTGVRSPLPLLRNEVSKSLKVWRFGTFLLCYEKRDRNVSGIMVWNYHCTYQEWYEIGRDMKVKKYFIVSLCRNGILGGGMIVDEQKITYKTGKLTVPDKFRNLEMRYEDIADVSTGRLLFLPTVTIKMKDAEAYRFVVFARKKFLTVLREMKKEPYDKEHLRPVIRSSICTGEKVAGFKDLESGKFMEVMLIRDKKDMDVFLEKYDVSVEEIKTEW